MLNEAHLTKLTRLIKISTILTSQEKTDWLALLELMNDKQLAELEEILNLDNSDSVVQAPPVVLTEKQAPRPVPTSPSQSLPDITQVLGSNAQSIQNDQSTPEILQNQPVASAAQKPQPSPSPQPNQRPKVRDIQTFNQADQTPKGVIPLRHIENLPSQFNIPDNISQSDDDSSVKAQQKEFTPSSKLKDHPTAESIPLKLEAFEDIKGLRAEMFNLETASQVSTALRSLANQLGYFTVLQEFEQSKLYKDYLEYGKFLLAGNKSDNQIFLSQAEFELVTDILLALKVNRG